jgi:hypothetical protein
MDFVANYASFHEQAVTATGLKDFGPADYEEPLRRMLSDLTHFSQFSDEGAASVAGEIIGRLAGRLIAVENFKRYPDIETARIERPIFIVGMARTGTTALLRLLTVNPEAQGLELWLGTNPMPRPPHETWKCNPIFQQIQAGLDQFYQAHPFIKIIHPMSADRPDECRFALDKTFWSPAAMNTTYLPEYAKWMIGIDASPHYAFYRRILALIGRGDSRQWVLKDPSHLFGIDALLKVFPDACIVQTHRALLPSLGSTGSGVWLARHAREPELTCEQLGRHMCDVWLPGLEKMEHVRAFMPQKQFFDVHISELHADTTGVVERIYKHFDLPISDTARAAWQQHAKADPRAGHGKHEFDEAVFGLRAEELAERAPNYSRRLDEVTRRATSRST